MRRKSRKQQGWGHTQDVLYPGLNQERKKKRKKKRKERKKKKKGHQSSCHVWRGSQTKRAIAAPKPYHLGGMQHVVCRHEHAYPPAHKKAPSLFPFCATQVRGMGSEWQESAPLDLRSGRTRCAPSTTAATSHPTKEIHVSRTNTRLRTDPRPRINPRPRTNIIARRCLYIWKPLATGGLFSPPPHPSARLPGPS